MATPAEPGEFRVFNQFTEQFSLLDLAAAVTRSATELGLSARVEHLDNPRVEAEGHYYSAAHAKLPELGLEPHLLGDDTVASLISVAARNRDRIDASRSCRRSGGTGERARPGGARRRTRARCPARSSVGETSVRHARHVTGVRARRVALARSLCAHSSLPLVVMCPPGLEELADWSRLDGTTADVRAVEPLPLSEPVRGAPSDGRRARPRSVPPRDQAGLPLDPRNFMKLRVWQLDEFERVAFLDADTLCIRDPDSIFRYEPFAGAPNVYTSADMRRRLNSGVFVLRPDRMRFSALLRRLDAPGAYWRRSDQTFLEAAFPTGTGFPRATTASSTSGSPCRSAGAGRRPCSCTTSSRSPGIAASRATRPSRRSRSCGGTCSRRAACPARLPAPPARAR
jgi:hypothetical protein